LRRIPGVRTFSEHCESWGGTPGYWRGLCVTNSWILMYLGVNWGCRVVTSLFHWRKLLVLAWLRVHIRVSIIIWVHIASETWHHRILARSCIIVGVRLINHGSSLSVWNRPLH
jgi:hypothetical protein